MNLVYREDAPAQSPKFDFQLIAKALATLLLQPSSSATVVGIHGAWGSGKTTLMQAVRRELVFQLNVEKTVVIEFNAWKFQDRQALWRSLILHILAELRQRGTDQTKIEELEQSLYRAFAVEEKGPWTINWRTLIIEIIGILLSILKLDFVAKSIKDSTGWIGRLFIGSKGDASKDEKKDKEEPVIDKERVEKLASVLERTTVERQVVQVQSIEQFLDKFRKLIEQFTADGQRVFVFIDDLDRCLPEAALEIFESIKLFLDAPGCGYIVALDREVIRKGLAVKYAQRGDIAAGQVFIDPDEYIEKTISISYDLPRLSTVDVNELIGEFQLPITLDARQKELILAGLGSNPRRIKRFMNTLALQLQLVQIAHQANLPVLDWMLTNSQPRTFDLFLKLLLIGYRHPGVFAFGLDDPTLCERLQKISNTYVNTLRDEGPFKARDKRKESLMDEVTTIQILHSDDTFWRLMAERPSLLDNPDTLAQLWNWFRVKPSQNVTG